MNSLLLAVRFLLLFFFLFSHRTTGTFGDIISEAISTEPETLESYKQTAGGCPQLSVCGAVPK